MADKELTLLETLILARKRLEKGITNHGMAEDKDRNEVHGDSPSAVKYSVPGALGIQYAEHDFQVKDGIQTKALLFIYDELQLGPSEIGIQRKAIAVWSWGNKRRLNVPDITAEMTRLIRILI